MPFGGHSRRGTGTSTPPRPTATRRVSVAGFTRAGCRARRSSSRRSSSPGAKTRSPRSKRAFAGSAWTTLTSTSFIGRPAARPGRGRGWSERVKPDMRGRSGSPTSASTTCGGCSQPRRSRRSWIRCSSVRTNTAKPYSTRAARTGSRWRPIAPLEPAATSPATRSRGSRGARSALPPRCCCAGASSGASRSSRSRPTASASPRTPSSSTSGSRTQDIAELDALDRTGGTDSALERKWWRS